jgi:hypothetical protein
MTERQKVRTLETKGTNAPEVQQKIAQAWDRIKNDPAIRQQAKAKGVDDAIFTTSSAPFVVERPTSQFNVDPDLIVWLAGVVAGHFTGKGLDWLWDDLVWPSVRQALGSKIKEKAEPEAKPDPKG